MCFKTTLWPGLCLLAFYSILCHHPGSCQIIQNYFSKSYKMFHFDGDTWPRIVYKVLPAGTVETRLVCGAHCAQAVGRRCSGFIFEKDSKTCMLLDIASGTLTLLPLATYSQNVFIQPCKYRKEWYWLKDINLMC